jgi:hypothetical protein
MKLCVGCYYFSDHGRRHNCCREMKSSINVVTGEIEYHGLKDCDMEREKTGANYCEVEGKFFKQLELTFSQQLVSCLGIGYDYIDRYERDRLDEEG